MWKLKDLFDVRIVELTEYVTVDEDKENAKKKKDTKQVKTPVVFVNNPERLVDIIMTERGLDPRNTVSQVGIDDGQGLLKIMLSIKSSVPDPEPPQKKMKYEDGFAPKDFLDSGVKKLITLLAAPAT